MVHSFRVSRRKRYGPGSARQRHKIENMFGRLKDWRRIATCYDRCAHAFVSAFSAICIPATVSFRL
jgi:transposase